MNRAWSRLHRNRSWLLGIRLASDVKVKSSDPLQTGALPMFGKSDPNHPVTVQPNTSLSLKPLRAEEIEKSSLSRGLVLNRFNKDFFIYPEYTETDDLRTILGYVETFRRDLQALVDSESVEKDGVLTEDVYKVLERSVVFSLPIPTEYKGLAMNQKGICRTMEEISLDWNVFKRVHNAYTFSQFLLAYGNQEQKEKYLPQIAGGKLKVAFAFDSPCEVIGGGDSSRISGAKINVVGDTDPDLLICFPTDNRQGRDAQSCVILEVKNPKTSDTVKFERLPSLGLKANFIGTLDLNIDVPEWCFLDTVGIRAQHLKAELRSFSRLHFAAAAIGFARRAIDEVTTACNTTQFSNIIDTSLGEQANVQKKLSDVSLKCYALESAVYYIGGLMDEGFPMIMDLEVALLHSMTIELLQSCVDTMIWLLPPNAQTHAKINDVIALVAQMREVGLNENAAMCAVSTWATAKHKRSANYFARFVRFDKEVIKLSRPRIQHFIAEHVHPSLMAACHEVEYSMVRIESILSTLMERNNKEIEEDYHMLDTMAKVLRNNFAMVACISRASRSHSVGLRYSDDEIAWVVHLCAILSRSSFFYLDSMQHIYGFFDYNPARMNVGQSVINMKGYKVESPLEKNW
ncbi:hypothetical protein WR25_10969 [Diploscapter pachys]|uniref:Acyl-CoA dehydrogenase/oxidase C-terminal domain-containing protein n=1 Tax=Diploscapter pachys TaxID=2018661 RepID=A0A2A2LYS1_9BILA|nr:hypothetical protein WR25_10969 [Diploscapter pachys]